MSKGYWIVSVDVEDAAGYAEYIKVVRPLLVRWDGVFLTRGGAYEIVEGNFRSRNIVIEFPSYARAKQCYHSEEYRAAMQFRITASQADLVIVEGMEAG